ncbi:MAG: tetratricopeptide repeat protein [Acidobacteriota bacterium]
MLSLNAKNHLGYLLKNLRKTHNLSLKKVESLSAITGRKISISYLSKIESGKTLPSIPVLLTLSKIYDVSPKLLIEKLELGHPSRPEEHALYCDEINFNSFPKLDESKIKTGLSFLTLRTKSSNVIKDKNIYLALLHAIVFLRKTGKLNLAKEASDQLILISQKNEQHLARAFFEFAFICKLQKNFPLALASIFECKRLLNQRRNLYLFPFALHLEGNILQHLGKITDALLSYQQALEEYEKRKYKKEICTTLNCMAVAYMTMKKFKKAKSLLERALLSAKEENLLRALSQTYHNLGCSCYFENKFDQAIGNCKESNTIAEKCNYYDILFFNYYYLMRIYDKLNDDSAKEFCKKNLDYLLHKISNFPLHDNEMQKYIEEQLAIAYR